MSIVNQDHIERIHIQIQGITRYFSNSFFAEEAAPKIYKLIRKICHVRQLNQLTISQYNVIMHHLRRLERAAYIHSLAISSLDQYLMKQMLDCSIIANTNDYKRADFSLEAYEKAHKKAKSIINFKQLFEYPN